MMRMGVDLGGTKIEAVVMAPDGTIEVRQRVPTPGNDYGAILKAVMELVTQVESVAGPCESVGVGTPGSFSPVTGCMRNANTTCLNGQYLQKDLEAILGREIKIANDANCFTLSEATDGAAAGAGTVFGVIIGTGVGGGIAVGGSLLSGPCGIGSEWGHNRLPGIGDIFDNQRRECYCGNTNCIETYLSGSGLAETYLLAAGKQVPATTICELAADGDNAASESLGIYQQQLACALSQVINLVDPDVIVLGGGLSNIRSLYENIPSLWQQWVFSDTVATRLLPARFGDSSGVRGAAWLWNEVNP